MAKKHPSVYQVTNEETGEVETISASTKRPHFDRDYMAIFMGNLPLLAKKSWTVPTANGKTEEISLSGTDFRVIFYCLSEMEYENHLWRFSQKAMAAALDIEAYQASKAVKKLCQMGFLEKDERGFLSISMEFVWRGSAGKFKAVQKQNRMAEEARLRKEADDREREEYERRLIEAKNLVRQRPSRTEYEEEEMSF